MVNLEKFEASFSGNVSEETKRGICLRMGVKPVLCHSKYLGLPVVFGRSNRELSAMVVESMWKKIKGWKETFLLKLRKEVLIKVEAQAIPNYIMECYKLSEAVYNLIEAMLARF